jgi:hypothetical protein
VISSPFLLYSYFEVCTGAPCRLGHKAIRDRGRKHHLSLSTPCYIFQKGPTWNNMQTNKRSLVLKIEDTLERGKLERPMDWKMTET